MFVDTKLAARIERAEVWLTRAVTNAASALGRVPGAFVRELGDGGVASYLRPGSPMNKLIGAGLGAPLEPALLASIEHEQRERCETTRVELCSLASVEALAFFAERGYRLAGFENVLVRTLAQPATPGDDTNIVCPLVTTEPMRSIWQETTVAAVAHPDETGVVLDQLSRESIEEVISDVLELSAFERYLALWNGEPAGAASLLIHEGVAMLGGSATLPAYRRRGVQAALTRARLESARQQGADIAVVTTAPGSQSQANVMRRGFALAYSRAILVLEPERAGARHL